MARTKQAAKVIKEVNMNKPKYYRRDARKSALATQGVKDDQRTVSEGGVVKIREKKRKKKKKPN